jgi:MFS family permease
VTIDAAAPPISIGTHSPYRVQADLSFTAYRILSRSYFHLPVLWVWLAVEQGISVWGVAVLLALYSGTLTFGAPFAQRLQRRLPAGRSLVLGELTKAAGLAIVVLAGDVVGAVALGQVVGGLGYSLGQGPDSVLLRTFYGDGDDDVAAYGTQESRSMSWVFIAVLVAGVAGGFLYDAAPASPFVASIAVTLLASVAGARLTSLAAAAAPAPEPVSPPTAPTGEPAATPTGASTEPAPAPPAVRLTPDERRWAVYYASVRGLAVAAFVALLPMVFFLDLEVRVALFGLVLGSFSVMAWLSGRFGTRALATVRPGLIPPVSVVALGGAFALFALADALPLALVAMAVLGTVNGVVRPLAMSRINAAPGRTRAERGRVVGSMERLYGAFNAVAVVVAGVVADAASATAALWTFSGAAVGLGLLGLLVGSGRRPATGA